MKRAAIALLISTVLGGLAARASAQGGGSDPDAVKAGRFDYGKMWTFEYAPTQYFTETYGFDANAQWFERARLAALRIPGCSASFVSPHGLIVTNHHCARGSVSRVTRPGESLLDSGFVAPSVAAERKIDNYYADQLIAIQDVSDAIFAATDRVAEADRESARRQATAGIQDRLRAQYGAQGDSIVVQVVGLYHGGRYSAYVFRRFTDIRLVAAAELQMGFFGGDADNFTYPRYDLDFAFLRVYGKDGKPFETDHWFRWSQEGVKDGDVVFVIGNPGPTNRLMTVAQLEYQRDVQVPAIVALLSSRLAAMEAFHGAQPREAEAYDVRNRMFGLSNSLKASTGRLTALNDPVIMARKLDAERQLRAAVQAREDLRTRFGDVLDRIADLQQQKRALGPGYGAFAMLGNPGVSPALIRRALAAAAYLAAPADAAPSLRSRLLRIGDVPVDLERRLLTTTLGDLARYLGDGDEVTQAALGGRSAADAAAALLAGSVLADSARTAQAVAGGTLGPSDPAMRLASVLAPRVAAFGAAYDRIGGAEDELASLLGRARFTVYGGDVPPDATSSPRITDGVVQGYSYNGTLAPWHTTFYGVYDRYFSHGPDSEWNLPERWRTPPKGLDLSTSLNFASTADTYGGNSGSPAVRPDLSIVGLNFDRNIEGLSRDFIYLPAQGRNVMVDVRAILAAMDHVYDGDRIVQEVTTGRLVQTEQEADRARH
jgi:hypothetical protein